LVKINRRLAIGLGTALMAASLPMLAAPASATGTMPPWEPDPSSINNAGGLLFYNAAGTPVTGGSDLTHLFDYAAGSSVDTTDGIKATLEFANPTPNEVTGLWPVGSGSTSTFTPPTSAPPPLNTDPDPVVTVGATGANLEAFITGHVPNTAASYVNVYQVRLVTSGGPSGGTTSAETYWESDIVVNPTAGTWVEEWPNQGASAVTTTTTLSASPASGAKQHAAVTLTATVTAGDSSHPAGSVAFSAPGQTLGSGTFDAATGIATLTTSALLASAPHGTKLSATFTPSDTSTYSPSTSANLSYTVNPVAKVPAISGPHQVGGIEKCSEGVLDFGVKGAYTWLVSGKKVATGASYKVAATAYKKKLSCSATVHDGSGPASAAATSKSVTVSLGKALRATKKPALAGPHKAGSLEKVGHGTWSPVASSYTYQWFVGSKAIKHATKASLRIPAVDKGKVITCHVTAHHAGYANGTAATKGVKVS
jgi:hypothetical protein